MKKFITLLLLCLTGMAAWATDIENVAFKNDAGMYLNAAVANDVVSVGTASQSFSIKAVSGETNAYQLYCNDISRWINSGTSGFLSSADAQTNARYFYFYQVSTASATTVVASPVDVPEAGKKYVIVVKNTNSGYEGYYAIYGQSASGKPNRLDVTNKLGTTAPSILMLGTTTQTSNGAADLTKIVWTVEQLAAPEPPVDVTKTYYLYDKGISQYVVIPSATGSSATITPSTTDKTAVKFAAVTGGYSIQDATTGNYIGIDSWNAVSTTTAQPWAIAKVEGGITIKNTSGTYAGSYFGGQDGKTKFYNNNDNPIVFSLEEVAPATKECPQCSEAVDIDATECPKCGYVFEAAPASGVTNLNATFSNTGTSWTGVNISVAATDADGNAVSGVTATVTGNTAPKTVTNPGTNCIVINKNSKDMSNEPLNFTISGLPAGSKFNRINLPMYAITGGGTFQQNAGQSDVTFKVTVIEGGNTLYENTITNFNVPQIQQGNLNDLLVYECGEDIVTNGGDVQVNFSMSKGSVNNGMCMAFQSLKLYYLGAVDYTVNVTGATGGGVSYDGHTYNNGDKITATGLNVADLVATSVDGYTSAISIEGTTVTVTYTPISYTFETSQAPVGGVWQNGTKFYSIKEMRKGYFYASELPAITNTTAPTTDDGKWAVIANGSYFQFMNKDTKKVLTFVSAANDAVAGVTDNLNDPYSLIDVVTYKNSKFEAGYECFKIANENAYPNDKGVGLAVWDSEQALWGWGYNASNPGNGDDGSKFLFTMVEELTSVTYTVNVVGAPTGETVAVTVKGEAVVNNTITLSSTASTADVVATTIAGYTYEVAINGTVITVTYTEQIPTAGKVYTIKAWFSNANPVYLTNAGGTTLTFPESVQGAIPEAAQGAKGYWVARESNGTYAWKLQSGYGDGRYLDGNASGSGLSATGFEIDIDEIAGTPYYSMWTNLTGKGARYVGTWCASHAPGFGLYGGAFGMSHSDANWTTKYIIEPVPNVTAYNVVCAMADGGIAPAFTGYTGATNVKAGGVIVVPNDVEINTTNFPVLPVTGYEGSVSASGNTITVTYEMTSIPVDVTYTFTVDGETIGTKTITEFQGEASTVASVIPSYVEATGIPATVEQNAYTIETSYTGLPFEVGTKQYYINEWAQNTRNYLLYSNGTNVKEIKQNCNTSDFDVNVRAEGTDTEAYLWTVGGDWLNGFTFKTADGYYMQSPSKTPSNSDVVKVTKTLDTNCYFEPFVQATSGKFSWRPMGGTNNFAHTSDTGLTMGFYNGYSGANLEATTFTFIEYVRTSIEIKIGATGYATMAYYDNFVKPEGLKAYYCINEGEAGHLTPVEWDKNYLPGYCAYILEGTPNTTYTFNYVASDFEIPDEDFDAVGTLFYGDVLFGNFDDTDMTVDAAKADFGNHIYVFSKVDEKMGFYTYVGSTLAAHKAFFATEDVSVNGFILDFEGTEGINSVISATNLKAGYDIQGRRINNIQKGINVINGKKIIK